MGRVGVGQWVGVNGLSICMVCSDISVNDKEKAYLQDIQQRRIPSHGSRVVPLELWGPEASVQCKVNFDVADVACPVVSLGKVIESGFTVQL